MQAVQLVLPTVATVALGLAVLVPLRDDRLGKRATLSGPVPLLADFDALEPDTPPEPEALRRPSAERSDASPYHAAVPALDVRTPEKCSARSISRGILDLVARYRRPPVALAAEPADPLDATLPEDAAILTERSFAEQLSELLPAPAPAAGLPSDASAEPRPLVVSRTTEPAARVVPLTRLPLRSEVETVTWPATMDSMQGNPTPVERHGLLLGAARSPRPRLGEALLQAYREEDAPGRVLALRALSKGKYAHSNAAFVDALHGGTDEERLIAIEALAANGARDDLPPAFSDRVDAIAACAALAYVGMQSRDGYRTALAPFVDAAQIETILSLLAGLVE